MDLKRSSGVLCGLVLLVLMSGPTLAGFDEQHSFSADRLTIRNLVGKVRISGHPGSDFEVDVQVKGKDASSERVTIKADGSTLEVRFPLDESRDFVYPELGSGSRTNFDIGDGDSSWLRKLLRGGRGEISVRGSGRGLEIWADITVRVPAGGQLMLGHGAGRVEAEDLDGKIELAVRSGSVEVHGARGELIVDTGSGHVEVEDVDGDLNIDTGSGHVQARRCSGDRVLVDTGSGHVEMEQITASRLNVDTGSGHVRASGVSTDSAEIDTGSGGVTLILDRMGSGDFTIDTGSGGIKLVLPAGASADVRADTGSGGIDLDLSEPVNIRYKRRDEIAFSVGGGSARVELSTGSGGIRISD